MVKLPLGVWLVIGHALRVSPCQFFDSGVDVFLAVAVSLAHPRHGGEVPLTSDPAHGSPTFCLIGLSFLSRAWERLAKVFLILLRWMSQKRYLVRMSLVLLVEPGEVHVVVQLPCFVDGNPTQARGFAVVTL